MAKEQSKKGPDEIEDQPIGSILWDRLKRTVSGDQEAYEQAKIARAKATQASADDLSTPEKDEEVVSDDEEAEGRDSESRFVQKGEKPGDKKDKKNLTPEEVQDKLEGYDEAKRKEIFDKEMEIVPDFNDFNDKELPANLDFVAKYKDELTSKLKDGIKYKQGGALESVVSTALGADYDKESIKTFAVYSKIYGLLNYCKTEFKRRYPGIEDLAKINKKDYSKTLKFDLSKTGTSVNFKVKEPDGFKADADVAKAAYEKSLSPEDLQLKDAGLDPEAMRVADEMRKSPFGKIFGIFLGGFMRTPVVGKDGQPLKDQATGQVIYKDGFYDIAAGTTPGASVWKVVAGFFGVSGCKEAVDGFMSVVPDQFKPYADKLKAYADTAVSKTMANEIAERVKANVGGMDSKTFIEKITNKDGFTVVAPGFTLVENLSFQTLLDQKIDYLEVIVPDGKLVSFDKWTGDKTKDESYVGMRNVVKIDGNKKEVSYEKDKCMSLSGGSYKITEDLPWNMKAMEGVKITAHKKEEASSASAPEQQTVPEKPAAKPE